jgi:iron complex transport system substrate-binding protein
MNSSVLRQRPGRALTAFVLAAGVATTAACGSSSEPEGSGGAGGTSAVKGGDSGQGDSGGTVTVKHASGTTEVPKNPKKVFVLDHTITDSLSVLGVKPAGAITTDAPEFIKKDYPSNVIGAGSLFDPNFDAIADAEPDVIFVGGRSSSQYKKLSEIAPTVDLSSEFGTKTVPAMRATSAPLGQIFGKESQVKTSIDGVSKRIDAIKKKVPKGDTALFLMVGGGKLSTFGPGSRFGTFFDDLGFTPAAKDLKKDSHGQVVSPEFVKQKDPDWLIVIDRDAAVGEKGKPAKQVLDNPLINSTKAAKNKKIVYLDGQRWYVLLGGLDNAGTRLAPIEKAVGVK